MNAPISDIVFTPSVKAKQQAQGSRAGYERFERERGWETRITPLLADFIREQNSMFIATANPDGQPYIQHRGGPRGFLHVLDEQSLAFADFSGNRQYITAGNLADNAKAQLFLMDYVHQQRVKVWGEARVVENDPELARQVTHADYKARVERVIVFTVKAWDANCHQHIPQLLRAEDVYAKLEKKDRRIAELEARLAALQPTPDNVQD
jgi:predicted pyridoxine 5'-phosphate oxidase superfamily flavin-nucleotide-binding protein